MCAVVLPLSGTRAAVNGRTMEIIAESAQLKSPEQRPNDEKRYRWMHLFIIAGAALIVYFNGLNNGFVGDDNGFVTNNLSIRSLKNIPAFFSSPKSMAANDPEWGTIIYRPLRTTSYAVDYFLFGLNSAGYHATNLALHISVCIVLYFIIYNLFHQSIASLAGAFIFAVHPVHVEAVSWIASRADLLGMLFVCLSLLFYMKYQNRKSTVLLAFSLIFSALAYLSKETMVSLPGIIILYDYAVDREKPFKDFLRSHIAAWIPFLLLCMMYLLLRFFITGRMSTNQGWWGGTPYSNFLMMAKATALYLKLLIFPFQLNLHYIIEPVHTVLDTKVSLSILIILSTFALIAYYYLKNRQVFFSLAFFYLGLVPIANIIPISFSMMAERYIYMPSAGPIIAAAYGINYLYQKSKPVKAFHLSGMALGALLVSVFSYTVITRNTIYRNDPAFYDAAVKESPGSAPSYKGLADQYANTGDERKALENYERALEIDPYYAEAMLNQAMVYAQLKDFVMAHLKARKAIELKPDKAEMRYIFGNILRVMGDLSGAGVEWKKAVELAPNYSQAYNSLGNYYFLYEKDYTRAAEMYAQSYAYDPDNAEAYYNSALIAEIQGDTSRARLHYRRFIKSAGPEYHDVIESVKRKYPE